MAKAELAMLTEIRNLLKRPPAIVETESAQSLLRRIIDIIKPLPEVTGVDPVIIRAVQVVAADSPVQGPEVEVPPNWVCVVRQRIHAGTPIGRVAASRNAIRNTGERVELEDGDSVMMNVPCMDDLWFDADTAATSFEIIVQRPVVQTFPPVEVAGLLAGPGAQRMPRNARAGKLAPTAPSVR